MKNGSSASGHAGPADCGPGLIHGYSIRSLHDENCTASWRMEPPRGARKLGACAWRLEGEEQEMELRSQDDSRLIYIYMYLHKYGWLKYMVDSITIYIYIWFNIYIYMWFNKYIYIWFHIRFNQPQGSDLTINKGISTMIFHKPIQGPSGIDPLFVDHFPHGKPFYLIHVSFTPRVTCSRFFWELDAAHEKPRPWTAESPRLDYCFCRVKLQFLVRINCPTSPNTCKILISRCSSHQCKYTIYKSM